MLGKIIKITAITAIVLILILVSFCVVSSLMIDDFVQKGISRFNQRQHDIELTYAPSSKDFLHKSGRLDVVIKKNREPFLSASFVTILDISLTDVHLAFKKIDGAGNIDDFIKKLNLPLIKITGSVDVFPLKLSATAKVKTHPFSIPLEESACSIGETELLATARNLTNPKLQYLFKGVICKGNTLYNARNSFDVSLKDLAIKIEPTIDLKKKKASLNALDVSFASLDATASTIYLIGFSPSDNVKDKSLRDSFKADNFHVNLELSKASQKDYFSLSSYGSVNLLMAFPYIKNNQIQTYNDLTDLKYNVDIDAFNLKELISFVKEPESFSNPVERILSPSFNVNLKELSFKNSGMKAQFRTNTNLLMHQGKVKLDSVAVNGYAKVEKDLVTLYLQDQYKMAFRDLIEKGAIVDAGNNYKTSFNFAHRRFYMNDILVNNLDNQNVSDNSSTDLQIDN